MHLNPDREQLLVTLVDTESDITQLARKLSAVAALLTKTPRVSCTII